MLTKDIAICIRAIDYSETSQIVTFFARATGKISIIAKGSKRPKSPFDGTIEIFSHGQIVFTDSSKENLATLTEFEQQPRFTHLGNDLFVLNCSLFAAELINRLMNEYDPHPQLFDQLLQFLADAQASKEHRDTLALLILFQLALLKEVGLQPILNTCSNCKSYFSVDFPASCFSSSANGLVCRDCNSNFHDKIKLTEKAANCLNNFKLIADSGQTTLSEIEKVLVSYFSEVLGWVPKMAKYILRT